MMNDREFENYLALLSGMLRLRRTQQSDIAGELRDHLIEHVAELERRGVSHEQAVREALTEFGDAAALAASFSALVRTRRRRLIMRCTIGTTLVMAGLMIGVFAFRPPVENDSIVVQAQEGPRETTKQATGGSGEVSTATRDLDQKTRTALKSLTALEFTEIPLKEALDYIKDKHAIQFFFDKRAMDEANVQTDTPVTFNMHSVPVEMVLDLILNQIRLGYTVRNGVVIVTTEESLANSAEVRVYRVPEGGADELAQLIPATIEPHSWRYAPVPAGLMGGSMSGEYGGAMAPGMSGAAGPAGAGGLGGGEGTMPFGAPGGMGMGGTGVGSPGGGFEEGGGVGSIRVFRGVLVVSQTPEVHQKIEKLLDDLEKVLPPQSGIRGAGMMGPRSTGYGSTTQPGAGYPGTSGRAPSYPDGGTGSPRYPGQGGSPRYPGQPHSPSYPSAGPPGYVTPSGDSASPATGEAGPPRGGESTGGPQPPSGAPTSTGEAEDAGPAPRGPSSGGSTTKEPPRTPERARN